MKSGPNESAAGRLSQSQSGERSVGQPVGLRRTAAEVAASYGDKGAIVISFGEEGVRIGAENLTPQELREALCSAIHYSYLLESAAQGDGR